MEERYNPGQIEKDARQHWSSTDAYRAIEHDPRFPKGKFYACSMLPYPSGILHMGHVRNYTINDVMYRYLRMNGYNVLMPMGWDAFGLPAENAAMKNNVAPAQWTYDNIAYMKRQMAPLGLAIDWSREVATCKPDYYKWNQWLFLKMRERGIAYRKSGTVNWDPVDQTVLANEQVIDGRGWRSGALVEKREIPMYYLRITDYAQELLDQVNQLDGWPERVRLMQSNWIGRSEGVRFAFTHDIRGADGQLVDGGRLHVFTTRADTIMGVTFVAVAPEHPLATVAGAAEPAVAAFIEKAKTGSAMEADLATMDKEGIRTQLTVTHPLTREKVQVWVGNYVLMSYGDGAVMGVPAHDERDFAFALKYGLPIRQVIDVPGETFSDQRWQDWYEDKQRGVCVNSGKYDGLPSNAAIDAVAGDLVRLGVGEKRTQWRLRDWGISRQRYWGTPIPIIHCESCGEVPVPYEDLPVVLPEDLVPDGSGNPLLKSEKFLSCRCPSCGKAARRETDTMDTFIDSSWYYMRYCSPDKDDAMVDERNDYWMPMDQYIGGIEHAVLHLLYARFWTKVMRDVGLVKFDEPFTRLLCQGMVLNHIYQRRNAKGGVEYFWPEDVENIYGDGGGHISGARLKSDGTMVDYAGVGTMSKSKNNGVDPQALIDRYGADTARLFVMFASPPEQTLEWSDSGVEGASRFLRRLWAFCHARQDVLRSAADRFDVGALSQPLRDLRFEVHTVLRQSTYDYERKQYNTVVSGAMKMLNALDGASQALPARAAVAAADAAALRECASILLRSLYPVVPHVAHALWVDLDLGRSARGPGDIIDAAWPAVDETALVRETQELVLQVNGKVRGQLQLPADAERAEIERRAAAAPEVLRLAEGRTPKRIVVVPGRLVNVVV